MSGGLLDGRVALITGAAQGIGAAEARLFAAEGARVVIADINEDGRKIAEEIGERARFVQLDVSRSQEWSKAVESTIDAFGEITVLVNNAGIHSVVKPSSKPLAESSEAEFTRIFEVNLLGQFLGIQAVAPSMRRAGGGSIVNTSSTAGFFARWGAIGYTSMAFGIRGLTKATAVDLGPDNIRVNVIHAGGVATAMRDGSGRSSELLKALNARRAVGRVGTPEEIASMALFLASDQSSYSTGAEFLADGGGLAGDPTRF